MSLVAERIAQHCQRLRLIHLTSEWPAIADAQVTRLHAPEKRSWTRLSTTRSRVTCSKSS